MNFETWQREREAAYTRARGLSAAFWLTLGGLGLLTVTAGILAVVWTLTNGTGR